MTPSESQMKKWQEEADAFGRNFDKNSNPQVFSKWSFLEGRKAGWAETQGLVEALRFYSGAADEVLDVRVRGYIKAGHPLEEIDFGEKALEALRQFESSTHAGDE